MKSSIEQSVKKFKQKEQVLNRMKKRFKTYGYEQIETSTFESYDLYSNVVGTIPQDEMIKVIDSSGKVLVLRPDVTIPITEEFVKSNGNLNKSKRYFYMLDVFRQSFDRYETKEKTQAGVEYFGDHSRLADAEVLALAIHTLDDLGDFNFKIEIGHAGFFKKLTSGLDLNDVHFKKLKQYIQQKNVIEIKPFLKQFNIDDNIIEAISSIPLLYGHPDEVISQAKSLVLNEQMTEELMYLKEVYNLLETYGISDRVVIDLGLINHMDYYTDIIFQGFIENIANPVLSGGRYNQLATDFSKNIPAIGFAYDIDLLLDALDCEEEKSIITAIIFDDENKKEALQIAYYLRNENFRIILSTDEDINNEQKLILIKNEKKFVTKQKTVSFETVNELKKLL